eukprot:1069231-Lingulodinium_polyedra.AAC.1
MDEVVALRCRADSRFRIDYAQWLKQQLLNAGHSHADLPRIDKHWLFKWRKQHGISIRNATT